VPIKAIRAGTTDGGLFSDTRKNDVMMKVIG